jgi:hypothetical protein
MVSLQMALVWVFGPIIIAAIPLVFALGTLAALLTAMLTFLAPRAKSAGVQS